MQETNQLNEIWQKAKTPLLFLGGFIVFLWLIELVDWLIFRGALNSYGIRPRTVDGLVGIFFAPFLHGSFGHLMANTLPLLVLGVLIIISRGLKDFLIATALITLISGLGTWLIGPAYSVHIGASGLVFGYFGFLLLMAYFERSCQSIVVAVLVFFFYGGMVWGILPRGDGISWQAHLFGLLGGVLAAYVLARRTHEPLPASSRSLEDEIVFFDSSE